MAGLFLTTPALQISLLSRESPLSKSLAATPVGELWVSPLSHAILTDTYTKASGLSDDLRRRVLRAIQSHRRKMEIGGLATYPLPSLEALRVWTEIRSVQVDVPAYSDGFATYPMQRVGPDELLVFATAASFALPLVGPSPSDPETIECLKDVGITFR
jgi:hypothetical protein